MPPANEIVGATQVTKTLPTASGVLIEFSMEDLATGQIRVERAPAPRAAGAWPLARLDIWVRQAAVDRIAAEQQREAAYVLDALRRGENPLRDSNGNPVGTAHLTYQELAGRVFAELSTSSDPHDKIIGARLVQSLTDAELVAATGLDSAGIQVLRDQAAVALQAAALMQQVGGEF